MKSKLKSNDGVALVMVLVLITILSFMGTAMYAYSMQSLDVVKWGSDKKKAEYIARAGIEAAAYAYQDTEFTSGSSGTTTDEVSASKYATEFIKAGKNATGSYSKGTGINGEAVSVYVTRGTETVPYSETDPNNPVITTNWIYVCKYQSGDSTALAKSGIVYIDGGSGDQPVDIDRDYVGYFRVQIVDDPRVVHTSSDCSKGQYCTDPDHYAIQEFKKFISKGYVGGKIATRTASIVSTDYQNNWIDKDGLITMGGFDTSGKPVDSHVSYVGTMKLNYPKYGGFATDDSFVNIYAGTVVGNLVVTNPGESAMHFPQSNTSHGTAFIGMNNLFMETAIDATPTKNTNSVGDLASDAWHAFVDNMINGAWGDKLNGAVSDIGGTIQSARAPNVNAIYLSGNNIIVHGDVDLYAFYFSMTWYDQVANLLNGSLLLNKRMGTVIINVPSTVQTTVDDPLSKASGGLGQCGKIYFDGDVYVTIGRRNSKGSKYKVFSAGDVYYFNAQFKNDNAAASPTGIDLLKYFLDTAIASGKYSSSITQQFKDVREFWYKDNFPNTYVAGDMRKINPKNKVDSITDLLPPSTSDSAYIIWE